jgi:dCMP deaminase
MFTIDKDINKEIEGRISWNNLWIEFANLVSKRSSDQKMKVGCVIVTRDNTKVIAIGYNGDQKGGSNKRESILSGESGFIHAEVNALIKANYDLIQDKIMYLTHSPCRMCAKAIINSEVKEVYFQNIYEEESILLLNKHGIKTQKIG